MTNRVLAGRPVVLIATATVAFLAVAFAVGVVMVGGPASGTAASSNGEVILAQDSGSNTDGVDEGPQAAAELPVTYDVFLARDPFETIRPPEPVATDSPDGTGTAIGVPGGNGTGTGTGTDGTTGDGSAAGGDGKDPMSPGAGGCETGTEAVCGGMVLVLDAVTAIGAQISVNGVPYSVGVGQTFAGNFQLLGVNDPCVEILYLNGDEADVFDLCTGVGVSK